MSDMKKMINKKGFTLVELIVVIAIIGVLAAILIPTMLGYIESAKKANDKTVAKSIYDRVKIAIVEDWDAWNSLYSYNTSWMAVTDDGLLKYEDWKKQPSDGQYKLVVSARINGAKSTDSKDYFWTGGSREVDYFAAVMNQKYDLVTLSNKTHKTDRTRSLKSTYWEITQTETAEGKKYREKKDTEFLLPMKCTSHDVDVMTYIKSANDPGNLTNRWLICYRADNQNLIEIWAGYSGGIGGSGPRYRIYPDPCFVYST